MSEEPSGAVDGAGVYLAGSLPPEEGTVKGERERAILKLAVEREGELAAMVKGVAGGDHPPTDGAPPPLLDVEFVHDLRVLTRRVTETTRLFAGIVEKPVSVGIGESLRSLRQAAGELRDLDVMGEHLRKWKFPGPVKKVAVGILVGVPERRAGLEEKLRTELKSASVEGMLFLQERVLRDAQDETRAEETERKLEAALQALTRRRRKQMEEAFGKAATKQTDKALHEARIAIKKLRYALEIASAAKVKGAKQAVRTLKGMQELLGTHHDVAVISETLRGAVEKAAVGQGISMVTRRKLRAAWRSWLRKTTREQARRAADFFMESYLWRNSDVRGVGEEAKAVKNATKGKLGLKKA